MRTTAKVLLRLAALPSRMRLVRSTRSGALAAFQKAVSARVLIVVARVERGFAEFADIPYQDVLTRQELSQVLDEFGSDAASFRRVVRRADQSTPPSGV
jgi:hypothetical protein